MKKDDTGKDAEMERQRMWDGRGWRGGRKQIVKMDDGRDDGRHKVERHRMEGSRDQISY